jgi:hypothetical protein
MVMLLAALVTACGAGPELTGTTSATIPATSTSTTRASTTTTAPANSTTVTPTPTTVASTTTTTPPTTTTTAQARSHACDDEPSSEVPQGAVELRRLSGDVDGDRSKDTVTAYSNGGGTFLHVNLSTGWGTTLQTDTIDNGDEFGDGPVGIVKMSGDRLIVTYIGSGGVGPVYGLIVLRDCVLTPVLLSDGTMPDLWMGGGASHIDWFSCGADGVSMFQFGLIGDTIGIGEHPDFGSGEGRFYEYDGSTFSAPVMVKVDFPITQAQARKKYPPCVSD